VQKFTLGKGANVIADPVGASNATRNVASLAIDGRWVLYGSMGGRIVENFDIGALVAKRGALLTTTLKTRSKEYKKSLLEDMSKIFFSQKFKPVTEKVFAMSSASEAHLLMESNTTVGKILLKQDLF
jgi:NADPH:quinone reductase-like Zn-dependent oxidoreductase